MARSLSTAPPLYSKDVWRQGGINKWALTLCCAALLLAVLWRYWQPPRTKQVASTRGAKRTRNTPARSKGKKGTSKRKLVRREREAAEPPEVPNSPRRELNDVSDDTESSARTAKADVDSGLQPAACPPQKLGLERQEHLQEVGQEEPSTVNGVAGKKRSRPRSARGRGCQVSQGESLGMQGVVGATFGRPPSAVRRQEQSSNLLSRREPSARPVGRSTCETSMLSRGQPVSAPMEAVSQSARAVVEAHPAVNSDEGSRRLVSCAFVGCSWTGVLSEFDEHVLRCSCQGERLGPKVPLEQVIAQGGNPTTTLTRSDIAQNADLPQLRQNRRALSCAISVMPNAAPLGGAALSTTLSGQGKAPATTQRLVMADAKTAGPVRL